MSIVAIDQARIGGRMTEAEYDRQRAAIARTKAEAGVRWEQELAKLFALSGWTFLELGKKEGVSGGTAGRRVRFGQFLTFLESEPQGSAIAKGLTEKRFRLCWLHCGVGTEGACNYSRSDFRVVARMLAAEPGERKKLPQGTSHVVIKKCSGDKFRSAGEIAERVGIEADQVPGIIHAIQTTHKDRATIESKRVGTETKYRIFKKEKTVSVEELAEKLSPLVEGLIAEGKKNMATMTPFTVAMYAAKIKKLLDDWTAE